LAVETHSHGPDPLPFHTRLDTFDRSMWTRKVDNKTVTRTLDPAKAERLRPLLDNSRRLRCLVQALARL